MTLEQLGYAINRIREFNSELPKEKLEDNKDYHSLLYNNGNSIWNFKFCNIGSCGAGIFTDCNKADLVISAEEIQAIYVNYVDNNDE
jgi:hypothetical protein